MVSVAPRISLRRPAFVARIDQAVNRASGASASTSSDRRSSVSRLEIVRTTFRRQGLSEKVVNLLLASNRPTTIAAYNSSWRNWGDLCVRRGQDPLSPPLASVLEYLTELHESGKSYSSINSHRSMLSRTLPHVNGRPIGVHPLVKNLLTACYNLNPPKPKYSGTWDPDLVLRHLSPVGPNSELPLPVLSQKVVILVALACLLRVSEIASIDASSLSFSSTGAKFTLLRLRKAQRSGAFQSFSLPAFSNSSCCPVEALRSYVDRTAPRRNNTNINYLFIALISPFKMVTASTISRWIRRILLSSGIDTQVFGAHSARGAGASKALASGASVDGILRSGHWARESTFARFYKRNVDSSVATAVIGSAQS